MYDSEFLQQFGESDGMSGGGAPLLDEEGTFVVRVTDAKIRQSKKDRAKLWLNVTFEIVESSCPTIVPPGSVRGFIHNVYDQFYGASGVKNWVAAMFGYQAGTEEAKTLGFVRDPNISEKENALAFSAHNAQMLELLTGEGADYESQPFYARLTTTAAVSKTGKTFTRKDWQPWAPAN